MKQYIIILFALLAFGACDEFENSAEKSVPTYLPLVKLNGEASIVVDCDAEGYTDEGCSMTEDGVELEVTTTNYGIYFDGHWTGGTGVWDEAHWEYDHSPIGGPDLYDVSYSAVNKDNIPGVSARSVYWPVCNGDMVTSIAGMYKMSVLRNGSKSGLPVDNNGPFFIKDLGDGVFALSDGMGGWYEHGRGFGPYDGPALGMQVTANDIVANDWTFGPTFSQTVFGGQVIITAFSVNSDAKTITFQTKWDSDLDGEFDNFTFDVVLTQCPDGVSCWD